VKFILDPEEEIGSPRLEEVLEAHAALLAANLLIFADGPVHQSGRSTVVFGSRGLVGVTLTLYGPAEPVHSGHYGNWAPNPAEKLAELLATLKDAEGRVLVDGFYDDVRPLSPAEQAALAATPAVEDGLQERLLIARPDGGGKSLQELINLPSLNVRGLSSAWVGAQRRTIVPATATAEIDLRLVTDVDPNEQVERLETHIRRQGYHVVADEPDAATRRAHPNVVWMTHGRGTPAFRTSMDTPLSKAVIAAVRRAAGDPPVLMPTLGGTVPMSRFQRVLDLPIYGVPVVNPDNNQHSPDENLRLGNLWEAIVVYASLLRMPAPEAP
jgi:acetylornithine deacetylase/succinyl-diaminopimelate desuccinylase-like protein